jgi:hypothetical protein
MYTEPTDEQNTYERNELGVVLTYENTHAPNKKNIYFFNSFISNQNDSDSIS